MNTGWRVFFAVVGYMAASAVTFGWLLHFYFNPPKSSFDPRAPLAVMCAVAWPLTLPFILAEVAFRPAPARQGEG